MFGPMFSQMMKARLGIGKPLEGYGGFGPPQGVSANGGFSQQGGVTPHPTPWGPQDGASLPAPSPWLHQKDNMGGATLPTPSPWLHQGGPRQTPFEPRPDGGTMPMENPWSPRQTPYEPRPDGGEAPWNPRKTGYEPRPQGGEPMTPKMPGMGMKNPWQRY